VTEVVDNLNGHYQVSYTPKVVGLYTLVIKLQPPGNAPAKPISGSPFDVEVAEREGTIERRSGPKVPPKPTSRPISTVDDMRRKYEDLSFSTSSPSKLSANDPRKFLLPSPTKALRFPESDQPRFMSTLLTTMSASNMAIYPVPGHMIYMTLVYHACQAQFDRVEKVLGDACRGIQDVALKPEVSLSDSVFWLSNVIHLSKSLDNDEGGRWRLFVEAQGKPEEGQDVDQKPLKYLVSPFKERLKDLTNEIYQNVIRLVQAQINPEKLCNCFLDALNKDPQRGVDFKPKKLSKPSSSKDMLTPDDRQGMRVELGKMAGERFGMVLDFIQKMNPGFEKSSTVEENVTRISGLEPQTLKQVQSYMNTLTRYPVDIWEEIGLGPVTGILSKLHTAMVVNNIPQPIITQLFSQMYFSFFLFFLFFLFFFFFFFFFLSFLDYSSSFFFFFLQHLLHRRGPNEQPHASQGEGEGEGEGEAPCNKPRAGDGA